MGKAEAKDALRPFARVHDGQLLSAADFNRVIAAIHTLETSLGLHPTQVPRFREGEVIGADRINGLIAPVNAVRAALGLPSSWRHHPVSDGQLYSAAHVNDLYAMINEAIEEVTARSTRD